MQWLIRWVEFNNRPSEPREQTDRLLQVLEQQEAGLHERVVFLTRGHVVADGVTADVLERFGHDNLEDVFLHLARQGDPV